MGKNGKQLGRAIIKSRFAGQRPRDDDTRLFTTDIDKTPKSVKLQSITQENDLDAFLRNAELAGTEFTAERRNLHIVSTSDDTHNPLVMSDAKMKEVQQKMTQYQDQLKVPRRPHWDSSTTADELDRNERDSFLEWRKSLAVLEEEKKMLMTPYERNLEVWRQLWRVVERSDIVVQILDARNPLFYRSEDLEKYVVEVDSSKVNVLLVNKADLLSKQQRESWAEYFVAQGIKFAFFSAYVASQATEDDQDDVQVDDQKVEQPKSISDVISCNELCEILLQFAPADKKEVVVGLCGYPNVGKSSTINALIQDKKVNVSATPGKTKHFQTLKGVIPSYPQITLCDCPGLVFPTFAATKADMVLNGVLNVDELRDYRSPSEMLVTRIPKWLLEYLYGITISVTSSNGFLDESQNKKISGQDLLLSLAQARGFMRSGQGNPDESRSARLVLKAYVNGELLYVYPPPGCEYDPEQFNQFSYQEGGRLHDVYLQAQAKLESKKTAQHSTYSESASSPVVNQKERRHAPKTFDKSFFQDQDSGAVGVKITGKYKQVPGFSRLNHFPHQSGYIMGGSGSGVGDGDSVAAASSAVGSTTSMLDIAAGGKKHHKNNKKRVKDHSWRV
ncbi:hypothetical protein MIR68_003746 [Amoeboaphelidium protococcarum]|nr:hypothetical protein MIR68_003746 [Amoeboaphelidium protococcarum]